MPLTQAGIFPVHLLPDTYRLYQSYDTWTEISLGRLIE
jgi:hypothetical protein